jgi:N-acetyl-alpha-D-glucosaminyl L-malate synthase BshA
VVTTLHGTDVTIVGQDKPLYPINRYGIEKSDIVTTVSQYQRQHTLEHFRVDTDIRVIYNFIDTDAFKPCATGNTSRDQMADPDEKIIMHVSNFREPKNPIGVVRSFAKTADRINARLVLVGDGPGMTEIRQHCSELKICEKVTYLGKIDNVEDVLPLADCVFQPSYRESFGMVMLEAMACKVPVVASNADGIPEVVIDGETGILADPDDHDALADALVRVCEDDDLAKRFANAGRERAISNFHHSLIVPQYLETYEECAR